MFSHLLLVKDDQGERQLVLDQSLFSIGRDPRCTIRLISQFVSRRHATLIQLPQEDGTNRYQIVDGSPKGKTSANGLLVNGQKLQTHTLCDHDKITFGPEVWVLYYLLECDPLTLADDMNSTVRSNRKIGL